MLDPTLVLIVLACFVTCRFIKLVVLFLLDVRMNVFRFQVSTV